MSNTETANAIDRVGLPGLSRVRHGVQGCTKKLKPIATARANAAWWLARPSAARLDANRHCGGILTWADRDRIREAIQRASAYRRQSIYGPFAPLPA